MITCNLSLILKFGYSVLFLPARKEDISLPLATLRHGCLILLSDLTWGFNLKAISLHKNWLAMMAAVELNCSQTGVFFILIFFLCQVLAGFGPKGELLSREGKVFVKLYFFQGDLPF